MRFAAISANIYGAAAATAKYATWLPGYDEDVDSVLQGVTGESSQVFSGTEIVVYHGNECLPRSPDAAQTLGLRLYVAEGFNRAFPRYQY